MRHVFEGKSLVTKHIQNMMFYIKRLWDGHTVRLSAVELIPFVNSSSDYYNNLNDGLKYKRKEVTYIITKDNSFKRIEGGSNG